MELLLNEGNGPAVLAGTACCMGLTCRTLRSPTGWNTSCVVPKMTTGATVESLSGLEASWSPMVLSVRLVLGIVLSSPAPPLLLLTPFGMLVAPAWVPSSDGLAK